VGTLRSRVPVRCCVVARDCKGMCVFGLRKLVIAR
jgi:hypothetical protein